MGKLSTKGADLEPQTQNYVKPILEPGEHYVHIVNVQLRPEHDPKFGEKLILTLEAESPGADFKGLAKDKNDATKGNYTGPIGFVSYSRYGFKDDVTPGGIQIVRDDELFKAIGILCREIGIQDWWDAQNLKYEHVNQLYAAFEKEAPYKDKWFYATIAGRQYMNKTYLNYELFFPRADRTLGKPFNVKKDQVMKFFTSEHIIYLTPGQQAKAAENKPADKPATTTASQPAADKSAPGTGNNVDFLNQGPQTESDKQADQFTKMLNEDADKQSKAFNVGPEDEGPAPWDM